MADVGAAVHDYQGWFVGPLTELPHEQGDISDLYQPSLVHGASLPGAADRLGILARVDSVVHAESGLEKATWTDADFDVMGWHDCRVHAVSVGEREEGDFPWNRVLLDLDYIVGWVDPAFLRRHFTFWMAPATLVFDEAWDIKGELDPGNDLLEIADLHRLESPDDRPDPLWHVEGQNFELHLRAPGYTQYLRTAPIHTRSQILTQAERGGLSFTERSFA